MSDMQQQIIHGHERRIELLLAEIARLTALNEGNGARAQSYFEETQRLKAIEEAAMALWAVVRRTDEHHEWLEPMAKLGNTLTGKPREEV